jgi:hypothetical protein
LTILLDEELRRLPVLLPDLQAVHDDVPNFVDGLRMADKHGVHLIPAMEIGNLNM